jgi:hypothetical protein
VGTSVRFEPPDVVALYRVAALRGISQNEAIRLAVRAFTASVLLETERPVDVA